MPEIRFEADADTVNIIDGYCAASVTRCTKPASTGKGRLLMWQPEFWKTSKRTCRMAVDLDKLRELIDGYGVIQADDLNALQQNVVDCQYGPEEEVAFLRAENAKLRSALADVELILTGLRGAIGHIELYPGDEQESGVTPCNAT